ncbi:tyrosine-type recombinase/integrase [Lacrimispora sphenoides]|uniref:tyrosine-type recombinase/integrase n=1 Tax=Lacrimispora sphenoides TaxID=29370 RepID=UPI000A49C1E2|nr:tyrosine-type recombinase/integrase [Lacrimispora sphenoides]SUY52601.1 Site-specific recombinase XerD [Lacrimispora sphenoides]
MPIILDRLAGIAIVEAPTTALLFPPSLANDITPHIFRHTYASDLYKAGVDIKQAQYLLGHPDIRTTLGTYTHLGYADIEIDKLETYYDAVKMQSDNDIIYFLYRLVRNFGYPQQFVDESILYL